jgi:DNA-binding SARP family transcriptional activator
LTPSESGTHVRVLGPVEVTGPLGPAVLTGSRQRALVALLAVNAGSVVAQSRLIDALWGSDPPRTAVKTLYSHVTRVRQALAAAGLPDALATRSPGYVLAVARADIDAWQFEDRVREARQQLATGAVVAAAASLHAGLALWRGDALQDADPAGWGAAEVSRLYEVRLTAFEDLWDAELRLGRHAAALGELERLLVTHPYRERLVGLLMLALYRSGRHTDALDAYLRLRAHLADQLGVDPGPDLARLHASILRRDVPDGTGFPLSVPTPTVHDGPRPAQLPPRTGHFTGRAQELEALTRALDDALGDTRIAVVSGPAGIGKTALAVQWGHATADRFPDGQLFLDLRGHSPDTTIGPAEALAHMLRSLGVPGDRVPVDLSERTSLYRSLMYGKRMLVVLDNAGRAEDLLPLVPATAGSLLVVTSRNQLAALATHHAVHAVGIDALDHGEAIGLLCRVLGAQRVDAEPDQAAELVELCGRMPLPLRIVAAKLVAGTHRKIGEVVAELVTVGRLEALAVEGDSRSVRTVFASAYRALSPPAARMFRLLGLHPGPTFAGHLGAAVTASTPANAGRYLDELATAHLVVDLKGGRYRFHDLIRLYAHERAQVDEDATGRDDAVGRIVDWYLAVAEAANQVLDRNRDRVVPTPRYRPPELPFRAEHQDTLAFLDGERDNLTPVVGFAAQHGHPAAAWQLTYLLTGFFDARGHWSDRVVACRLGLAAAQRLGEPVAEGLMHSALGMAYAMTRSFDEAIDHHQRALELMRASGDDRGEGHAYNNIATAYAGQQRFDDAIEAFQRALALHTANGHQVGVVLALNNIGHANTLTGRSEQAIGYLDRALEIARTIGHPRLEAIVLHSLGQAYLKDGNHGAALTRFREALAIPRRIGDRRFEAETLRHIGAVHAAERDFPTAQENLAQALALSREMANTHVEALVVASIGRVYAQSGHFDAACEHFRQALVLRARTPDALEEADIRRALSEVEASRLLSTG